MMRWIIAYIASGAAFLAGDIVWLTVMGPRLYRPAIGPLLADKMNPAAAVAFYLLYLVGVVAFGVAPGLREGGWTRSLAWGALFGLIAYATYDLTNQATLKLWPTRLSLADMAWGAAITAAASAAGCAAALAVGKR